MPGFQDAWARQQAALVGNDPDRFTVNTPTDPGHGDKSEAPAPLMMDAPQAPGGGEIYFDGYFENRMHLPNPTLIDREPVGIGTPEQTGHGYGGRFNPGATTAELGFVRGRDMGAADRQTRTDSKYRHFDDDFYGLSIDAYRDVPINRMGPGNPVFIRGINGHPANDGPSGRPWAWRVNSPSWHLGVYEESKIQRNFQPPTLDRNGTPKVVEADITTIIGDAPPPSKSDVYASPWSALQKFMPKRRRVSGIRRDPGPWDEDMQARNPSPDYAGFNGDNLVVP